MNAQIEVPYNPSDAARLNRRLGLLQKLKWEQDADGKVRPAGPADALNDLGLYMLGHEIDMAVERQKADAAPVIPEGWALVPVEPAPVMMDAGLYQSSHDSEWADVFSAWKDMVAVAPQPPLRTEAAVRAEARREALEQAASWLSECPPHLSIQEYCAGLRALIAENGGVS